MTLQNSTHLRGSTKTFDFKHSSRKLGKVTISVNAINESNGKRKAWEQVRTMYLQKS